MLFIIPVLKKLCLNWFTQPGQPFWISPRLKVMPGVEVHEPAIDFHTVANDIYFWVAKKNPWYSKNGGILLTPYTVKIKSSHHKIEQEIVYNTVNNYSNVGNYICSLFRMSYRFLILFFLTVTLLQRQALTLLLHFIITSLCINTGFLKADVYESDIHPSNLYCHKPPREEGWKKKNTGDRKKDSICHRMFMQWHQHV